MNDLVSICIGTYNREKYIEETLKSLFKQSYTNLEFIISDNCSTDNTLNIINSLFKRVNYKHKIILQEKNIGPHANYNDAIKHAKGDFICLFHSDDIYHENIVEESILKLNQDESIGIVFSMQSNLVNENIKSEKNYIIKKNDVCGSYEYYMRYLLNNIKNPFSAPTAVWRREALLDEIPFVERYPDADDLYQSLNTLSKGWNIHINKKNRLFYRFHSDQDSIQQRRTFIKNEQGLFRVIRHFLNAKPIDIPKKVITSFFAKSYLIKMEQALKLKDHSNYIEYEEKLKKLSRKDLKFKILLFSLFPKFFFLIKKILIKSYR